MKKVLDLLAQLHSKDGFQFKKTVTIPWVGTDLDLTISVTCQNPTKISLTSDDQHGTITFDQNAPVIHIPRIMVTTHLTSIDFSEKSAIFRLSGFPDIEYNF